MAAINVLVVGDGLYQGTYDGQSVDGINFLPTQDVTDNTFTVSEFIYLLSHNPAPIIKVDTANRRPDPNATFQNFNFATSVDLSHYDVIWLFGYEGWNGDYLGSPISDSGTDNELLAITQFMEGGGGVFATGDHNGMGSYMCGKIPRVGSMRKWFGQSSDIPAGYPTSSVNYAGVTVPSVNWPGLSDGALGRADTLQMNPSDTSALFQFDDQSDDLPQTLSFPGIVHSILQGPNGPISRFPDHMHEGEVVTPVNLNQTLSVGGQTFVEYPTVAGFQPAPAVIATGNIVGGHGTQVEGSMCEQNNFTTDNTPTVANTIGIVCAYDGRGAGVGRVVTDSSFHHYLDLNLIGDPCGSSPDRMAGFGPGYTAPASGGVLADLQAFYVNTVIWLARVDRNFYFSVDKSSFGYDEAFAGGVFPSYFSFWLVVDGYLPSVVQSSLSSLAFGGAFNSLGVISPPGALQLEIPGSPDMAQRVLIPFSVQFSPTSIGAFPTGAQTAIQLLLEAGISIGGSSYIAETTFELAPGEDPCFQNIDPNANPPNPFYQSQDLCVFTVTPGVPGANSVAWPGRSVPFTSGNPTGQDDAGAWAFITQLLSTMNSDTTLTTPSNSNNPFPSFPTQIITAGGAAGDSSVTPYVAAGSTRYTSYNFAVARVRLNGPINNSAQVKVFFRLFITQTSDTDYQPNTSYYSQLDALGLPVEPLPAPDGETTPFFATAMGAAGDYATGGPNNQLITILSSQGAWHYFGCFLNVYDPALNLQMMGTHHCIVAQIAYDDAPIVNSNGVTAGPENSDKLAQRNMQVTYAS